MSLKRVGRTISAIGKKAGVVVGAELGNYASAHDLRRAFGTPWAKRCTPLQLMKLVRHESIEVTNRYYAEVEAFELSGDLRDRFGGIASSAVGETAAG